MVKKSKPAKISFAQRLIQRTEKFARKKHAPDPVPYKISGRRIYIIPTKFGAVYAFAIFILLLGSMNYSNALAFFLTFSLAATGFVAMHLTHMNLSGIKIEPTVTEPVFAGDPAILKLKLKAQSKRTRPEILISNHHANDNFKSINVDARENYSRLIISTHQRGYVELDFVNISTRFPLNLFYAWTVAFQPLKCLVYPKPSAVAPEVYGANSDDNGNKFVQRPGQDDFAGLRDYQWQDSPQHIAWKSFASQEKLLVKQFNASVSKTVLFDFDTLDSKDPEERLSQLCRLILDADKARQNYGLRLGNTLIPPNSGSQHKHVCLRALALFNDQPGTA